MKNLFYFMNLEYNDKNAHIDKLEDINILNDEGQNILHSACAGGDLDSVMYLIKKKINLSKQDNLGRTPLHYSAEHKNIEISLELISAGADISLCDNYGNQPLWTAVFNAEEDLRLVRVLIKSGSNRDHKNNNNKSPLDLAVDDDDDELIHILNGQQELNEK